MHVGAIATISDTQTTGAKVLNYNVYSPENTGRVIRQRQIYTHMIKRSSADADNALDANEAVPNK